MWLFSNKRKLTQTGWFGTWPHLQTPADHSVNGGGGTEAQHRVPTHPLLFWRQWALHWRGCHPPLGGHQEGEGVEAHWVGSWALVLASVGVRPRHVAAQSQGGPARGAGRLAGPGSALLRAECWGAWVSWVGCARAAPVPAPLADPGHLAWRGTVGSAWGAAEGGDWAHA